MPRNKIIPYRRDLREKARALRKNSTPGETRLWQQIARKQLGFEFHRQVPILDYIVDFYCHELQLAIEIDGRSHEIDGQFRADTVRESRLRSVGVTIIRFSEDDAYHDPSGVAETIGRFAEEVATGKEPDPARP